MINKNITGSIVLYENDNRMVEKAIDSFFNNDMVSNLYLIDNSKSNKLEYLKNHDQRIFYIKNSDNIGYGAGHNIAIKKSFKGNVKYHLILNPDISFESGVLEELKMYMDSNPEVGLVSPKVIYPNGDLQYLCKLIPSPLDLFGRRFLPKSMMLNRNNKFEMRDTGYNYIFDAPYLSGCFMFLRTDILRIVGCFDQRFFMYPEDIDLSRRINEKNRTVFYPKVTIVHDHAKQSYSNKKMLVVHLYNIIKYFNKWGWIFDEKRKLQNKKTLSELKLLK